MLPQTDFRDDQKQYLSGFVAGADAARAARGIPTFAQTLGLAPADLPGGSNGAARDSEAPLPAGPEAIIEQGRRRFEAAGQKLCAEELAKRAKHPLDLWDEMQAAAAAGKFPKGTDVLLWKFHGLFYVAPAQNSYMTRLRFPAGIITAAQLRGVADLAEQYAGQYADVTTRANLQLREISAANGVNVLLGLQDLGIVNRGAGADNVRNITAPCTAGIDPHEIYDVRELARQMHYRILYQRELYGLPRKFNIAFDGGGTTTALEDTNDIGFAAVHVKEGNAAKSQGIEPSVYFRVQLGGITGHKDFARDCGLLLKPSQCIPAAVAILKVFIEFGDRTDRKKARLKYLLDSWGFEKFTTEAEKRVGFAFPRLPLADCEPRGPILKHAHVGVLPQKQAGRRYLGVVLPVGRMKLDQMRGLAKLAERYGSGTLRLTVWQNIVLPDIAEHDIVSVQAAVEELGLLVNAGNLRGALTACTGNAGCKFAAANTKKHAMELIEFLEDRLQIDLPVNIHLTGCPHSCAQHYIGDIGMLGTKVANGAEMVEGYHVFVGGGYGHEQGIGRELYRNVPATDLPDCVEALLRFWLKERRDNQEAFREFVLRTPTEEFLRRCEFRLEQTLV